MIIMKYLKTFESYTSENEKVGIDWEDNFSAEERDIIEQNVWITISDMVKEGYTSGELYGEEPNFNGSWTVEIQEDDNEDYIRNEEVASKISQGYSSGYDPTFYWKANVWRD